MLEYNSWIIERPLPVSYTHLRAHETPEQLVCRLLLEKKKVTLACSLGQVERVLLQGLVGALGGGRRHPLVAAHLPQRREEGVTLHSGVAQHRPCGPVVLG